MSVDPNAPKAADRPNTGRRFKRSLTAVAIAGALVVPAAAVTVVAQPWSNDAAVAASPKGHENGKGKGLDHMTADEAEAELRECLAGTNLEEAKDLDVRTLVKVMRCLELVDSIGDPDSPLTEKEARQLVKQALQAAEAFGMDREQLPGALSVLSDTGLAKPLAGERVAALVDLMAESEALEDYANREININQASKEIAETIVALAEASAKADASGK